jgi:transcriptional regulator with XRE-family HTH domain
MAQLCQKAYPDVKPFGLRHAMTFSKASVVATQRRRRERDTSVGERIKEARAKLGWSQVELAEAAGILQPTLQKVEAGKREPAIGLVMAVANALSLSLDELMSGATPPARDRPTALPNAVVELSRELEAQAEWNMRLLAVLEAHGIDIGSLRQPPGA